MCNSSIPDAFQKIFQLISHDYFKNYTMYNLKDSRNTVLDNNTKAFTSSSLFQKTMKYRSINPEHVVSLFRI